MDVDEALFTLAMNFLLVPGASWTCPARDAGTFLVVLLGTFGRGRGDEVVYGLVSLRLLQLSYGSGQFLCQKGASFRHCSMPATDCVSEISTASLRIE